MKLSRIPVYLSLIILLFALPSCSKKDKTYKIGISQCSSDDWRRKMNEEIEREMMFHPEAEVEIRSADDSNDKQIADIKYFRDNGFDIIIAAPNEAKAITPAIKEAYDAGIPVVTFDRNIEGDSYTARMEVDNVGLGASAARYAGHLFPSGFKAIEIRGLEGSTPARERHEGFLSTLNSQLSTLKATAAADWNQDDAERVADSLLNLYPDVDLIYAHNDRMAIGASKVARRRGLKDVKVIGIDAAPEIGIKAVADGDIDATFIYPTEGHRLVRLALSILKGEEYPKTLNLPLSSAVDKSNADILLLQNESLKEETSKMELLKSQVDDYWSKHSAQTSLLYAMIAALVLFCIFIFVVLRTYWANKKHQEALQAKNAVIERERDKQKELNAQLNDAIQSKLIFFTNVSHDLRTPLTLIAEPVEQLAHASNLTPQQSSLMRIANKNVRILRRLINQILDFRKYENGKLGLHLSEANLAGLIGEWSESFGELARKRRIKFHADIHADEGTPTVAVDVEKMERIFFNIVSNAFKYTPANGSISIHYSNDAEQILFSVADTGQGIPKEDIANIFDRFFQVDKVHPKGSGIGLSLAKAFVELHGGRISVESELGKGTTFTVELPVRHTDEKTEIPDNLLTAADVADELDEVEMPEINPEDTRPLLLVVDDNADIRKMVGQLVGEDYNVISAANGREGVRMAAKYVPDLIVCDVMMPVMDGMECCRRIKEEISTSHIPVLMLTACSMDEQRVEGYDSGADGYLSKPFSSELLKARLRSLLQNRKLLQQALGQLGIRNEKLEIANQGKRASAAAGGGNWPINPGASPGGARKDDIAPEGQAVAPKAQQPPVSSSDRQLAMESEFYAKFLDIVQAELGNPDLNVDSLADRMGLGRSQFYRKIKAITNFSPVELLRDMRLKRGRELLLTTDRSISEVAYAVGFSNPGYFAKCFRTLFGETPSDLRGRL